VIDPGLVCIFVATSERFLVVVYYGPHVAIASCRSTSSPQYCMTNGAAIHGFVASSERRCYASISCILWISTQSKSNALNQLSHF
jgi:hypothetical protein